MESEPLSVQDEMSGKEALPIGVNPVGSTFVVVAVLLFGRLGGLIRELIVAPLFGAGAEVDALVAARTVPDLILIIATAGAVNSVIVPALSHLSGGQDDVSDDAWQAISVACNWLLVLALGITVLGVLFPQAFLALVASGLDPMRATLSAKLLQVMLPVTVLATASAILGALLNYRGYFGLPSSRAVIINGAIIAITLLFWRSLGIASVAVGWLVGAFLQFVILIPLATQSAIRYKLSLDPRGPGAKHVLGLMVPIFVSQLFFYGRYVVERWFASWLPEGSLAQLNYAYRISAIPWLILVNSVTTVYITTFSKQVADDNLSSLLRSFGQGLRIVAIGIAPCIAVFVGLARPTVQILLQRGAFGISDTLATASLLQWYGISLFAWSLVALFSQVCYAMRDGITPAVALGVGLVLQWASTVLLISRLGKLGVAIGTCVGLFSAVAVLIATLKRKLPMMEISSGWATSMLARVLYAGLGMLFLCILLYGGLTKLVPAWPYWMSYSVSVGIGGTAYMAILWCFRVPEVRLVIARICQRLGIQRSVS